MKRHEKTRIGHGDCIKLRKVRWKAYQKKDENVFRALVQDVFSFYGDRFTYLICIVLRLNKSEEVLSVTRTKRFDVIWT